MLQLLADEMDTPSRRGRRTRSLFPEVLPYAESGRSLDIGEAGVQGVQASQEGFGGEFERKTDPTRSGSSLYEPTCRN
jgi:hypothetical protein